MKQQEPTKLENNQNAEQKLTLQEKFLMLREAVPAIRQKAHSDGVKYKFAKIFDVYELLTPAMNKFRVNFDIISEKATHHDNNGDELYYHSYKQTTRNGVRLVWVYEADLTICWTNADDPTDILKVTLHAIGTNDSGPDKAKGAAWTYCLKYYFFEKFGIDQGDDDPDMTINSYQVYNSCEQKILSDAQIARMYKKAEIAGISKNKISESISKKYGKEDPRYLSRVQYDSICNALDSKVNHSKVGIAL